MLCYALARFVFSRSGTVAKSELNTQQTVQQRNTTETFNAALSHTECPLCSAPNISSQ